jgi:hypothetical protein
MAKDPVDWIGLRAGVTRAAADEHRDREGDASERHE